MYITKTKHKIKLIKSELSCNLISDCWQINYLEGITLVINLIEQLLCTLFLNIDCFVIPKKAYEPYFFVKKWYNYYGIVRKVSN